MSAMSSSSTPSANSKGKSIPVSVSHSRKLRRLALAAQGLTQEAPFGRGKAAVVSSIEHLGYVQIDTISVVERAHHHVLWSRLPGYKPQWLEQLVADKQLFEYWFHAAAYLPMRDFRFALPRMHAIRNGEKHWFSNDAKSRRAMREVLARIHAEGPLRARDFVDPVASGGNGWWEWKPAKQALEQLFIQGQIMVVGRDGFQKRYDVIERALPTGINCDLPTLHEQACHLIDTNLRAHGFINKKSISYLRKGADLRAAIKSELDARIDASVLECNALPGHGDIYAPCGLFDSPVVKINASRVRILSPFDNSVIQRERLTAIFNFNYQIECYVPAAKRHYGYFCLPILFGDRFAGRIDCKVHRPKKNRANKSASGRLEVVALYLSQTAGDKFIAGLGAELHRFARFNQCDRIDLGGVKPASTRRQIGQCMAID